MKIYAPIDKAGRVVIPKSIRDRYGLEPGTQIEFLVREDSVALRPVPPQAGCLREKEGVLVLNCAVDGEPNHRALRDERLTHTSGVAD